MTPIRVLLIRRHNNHYRHLTGWWSYPIDQFVWAERAVDDQGFRLDVREIERAYDLIVLDDWTFGRLSNRTIPLAYVVVDSARSVEQLRRNVLQGSQSDLLLIDSDDLDKFRGLGK